MLVCEKYIKEEFDNVGRLVNYETVIPKDFNFAFDVVDKLADEKPTKLAMHYISNEGEEKEISFLEMKEKSNQCANFLKDLGIKKGDMVMLILKRHYEWWYLMMGLHKLGAVAIPATNQLLAKDLVYRFNSAKVKMVLATNEDVLLDAIDEASLKCETLTKKVVVRGDRNDGWINFWGEIEKYSKEFNRPTGENATTKDDLMLMYFTSGTTGFPKMVIHSHSYAVAHIMTARHWHNVVPDGLHMTVAETGWGKAVWGNLYGQWFCETAILNYDFDRFDADSLLECISKNKLTTFCAPPTIYRFMIQHDLTKFDLSCLTHATIAGEALNPEVFEKFKEITGLKLMEGFGQTETTLTVATLSFMEPKPGSMGKPSLQYDVRLIDGDDREVSPGEIGQIVVKTDEKIPVGLFKQYYLNQEATNKAWHDGYYRTGDLAWQDEDGYLWYVGRDDDIIKSSGYRIGPFEVESSLMEHDAVMECAVTGVPDPIRGQVVKATIVLTKNYEPSEELKKDIQNYVKHATAPYKYPRIVEFVKELPKTISGKIRRVEIRENDSK